MTILYDYYRYNKKIVLWLKKENHDIKLTKKYEAYFYIDKQAKKYLDTQKIPYKQTTKKDIYGKKQDILKIHVPKNRTKESYVKLIEKGTKYKIPLYDADLKPEQRYLYENNLKPFHKIQKKNNKLHSTKTQTPNLKTLHLNFQTTRPNHKGQIKNMTFNNKKITKNPLKKFLKAFKKHNPDVIIMPRIYKKLPKLEQELKKIKPNFSFHKFNKKPLRYKGSNSFHTYGQVRFTDFSFTIHGRFLIDQKSMIGQECNYSSIIELCQLTGCSFSKASGKSFGSIFQQGLIRTIVQSNLLVPYKQKPVDKPMTLKQLSKADSGGLSLNPQIGFHKDVAEIDFSSMYPWIIYNKNVSAETILTKTTHEDTPPNVPIRISREFKGIVSKTIKPLIDRRMELKKRNDKESKERSKGLKWVLVTSYGYLRFREFKLGLATSHMTICSYSRKILLKAKEMAEQKGFEVVHGVVDSLYIKKKGITKEEVESLCEEISYETGIPIMNEGLFKWIVFLPSITDKDIPTPTKHYAVWKEEGIKIRGVMSRKRSVSPFVKNFQKQCLELLKKANTQQEIKTSLPRILHVLKKKLKNIHKINKKSFLQKTKIAKTTYSSNLPQAQITRKLKRKGIHIQPGQTIQYYQSVNGAKLYEEQGSINKKYYETRLLKAVTELYQGIDVSEEDIIHEYKNLYQYNLLQYT